MTLLKTEFSLKIHLVHSVSGIKDDQLMLRGEIVAGYSQIITKDTNTLSGHNAIFFLILSLVIRTVTYGP